MAGNYPGLGAALFGSVLLHASLLYVPLSLPGWTGQTQERLNVAFAPRAIPGELPVPSVVAGESEQFPPPEARPSEQDIAIKDTNSDSANRAGESGVGADDSLTGGQGGDIPPLFTLVTAPIIYFPANQLTRRPILKSPVLQEEPGRIYPDSESTLLVRLNAEGRVDEVLVLATNNTVISTAATEAFRGARYFPGLLGNSPVASELLIRVYSSPVGIVIN